MTGKNIKLTQKIVVALAAITAVSSAVFVPRLFDDGDAIAAQTYTLDATAEHPPGYAETNFLVGEFPNTDDGLPIMQVNPSWNNTVDPFVNYSRGFSVSWRARKARPHQGIYLSTDELIERHFIDPVTMLPQGIPVGYEKIESPLFRYAARGYPEFFAGVWVAEWEGDADGRFDLGCAGGQKNVSKSRIEMTCKASDDAWSRFQFTRIGEGGIKKFAIFRKENEDLYRQGVIFQPRFVNDLKKYKIIRTLDIQSASASCVRSVDQLVKKSSAHWSSKEECGVSPSYPRGTPVEVLFDMAVASETALWMHVSGLIGAPAEIDNSTVWDGRGSNERIRQTVNQDGAEIINSAEWRKYSDEIVRSLIASGYPKDRILYVELGNEVWNFGNRAFGRMTNYYWGLGAALKAEGLPVEGEPFRWALGYMTAQFMTEIDASLKAQGRQQAVVFVLAGQMAGLRRTETALKGFDAYFAQHKIDPKAYAACLGVSTASYFYDGNAFDAEKGLFPAKTNEERDAKWIAAIKDDPVGTERALTQRITSGPPSSMGSLAWVVALRREHQTLAEKYGAFFLGDYEGHDHMGGPSSLKKNPAFVNWMEDWRAGPEGAKVTTAWIKSLQTQNPQAVISNYSTIGARDPEGDDPRDSRLAFPWVDRFWNEETERTEAFDRFLRPVEQE